MIIRTPCFTLRPIAQDDAPAFARLCDDATLARNTARIPHPYTLADARSFVAYAGAAFAAKSEFAFAVCEDGDIIGCAGVTCSGDDYELGYWVAAAARGKGAASEAAAAVARFAFETLGAQIISAGHFTDNPASRRVLDKLGFNPTGETVELFSLGRGMTVTTVRVALARDDFVAPADGNFA